jgi:uncharacterized OsmC-like protein
MSKELIDKFTKDGSLAQKNLMVKTTKGENFRAVADFGKVKLQSDAPAGLGGNDDGPSPLLVILGVIGQCYCTVTQFWSQKMDVEISTLDVLVRGQIDLRNLLGMQDGPVGYSNINIRVKATGPDTEKIRKLLDVVRTHCPIFEMIQATKCKLEIDAKAYNPGENLDQDA